MPVVSSLGMMWEQTCLHDLGFLETEVLPARTGRGLQSFCTQDITNRALCNTDQMNSPKQGGHNDAQPMEGPHWWRIKKRHHRETALGHLPTCEGSSKWRGTTGTTCVPPDNNNLKETTWDLPRVYILLESERGELQAGSLKPSWLLPFLSASVKKFNRNQATISWRPSRFERWTRSVVVLFAY